MSHFPQQSVYGDNARAEVQPWIPRTAAAVLDVGCGEGGFGRTLRATLAPDARICGVDAVIDNVEAARRTESFDKVTHGYFPEALGNSEDKYDLITFLDVLEHMFDPWSVLASTHDYLLPGGKVVAAIPNVQVWTLMRALVRGRWDYTDTGILDRTHVRFFTKATMIEMFEGAGFVVESCEGINSQRVPPRPVRAVINRRLFIDMKWVPYVIPSSAWLQYVVVGRKD